MTFIWYKSNAFNLLSLNIALTILRAVFSTVKTIAWDFEYELGLAMFGTLSNLRSSKSYLALLLLFGSLSNLSGVGATDAVKENDKYEN